MPRVPHLTNARHLLFPSHLYITLTTDDLLWPRFLDDRFRLKILLHTAAQVVREVVDELYPGVRIGMIYTIRAAPPTIPSPHLLPLSPGPLPKIQNR